MTLAIDDPSSLAVPYEAAFPTSWKLFDQAKAIFPNGVTHDLRYLEPFPDVVGAAEEAIRAEGIEPVRVPIRGGTDGSLLSAMGLPTPNIFTGGHEYHSVREWASVQDMGAAAATVVRLAEVWARRAPGRRPNP